MKEKKLTKKIESIILRKKINSFSFFSLEYAIKTSLFFKKNKQSTMLFNNISLKHPLGCQSFKNLTDLKNYTGKRQGKLVYIKINKIFMKQYGHTNVYKNEDHNLQLLLFQFKKIYCFWGWV